MPLPMLYLNNENLKTKFVCEIMKSAALDKLDRLVMTDTIRAFLKNLPIKSMKEIRQSRSIYEAEGQLKDSDISIQIKRSKKTKIVVVKQHGVLFIHPINNTDDGVTAAKKLLQNIL